MAHSKKEIERAYLAYNQCRTIWGTAKLTGVAPVTLRKWRAKYNWEDKIEADKQLIATDPFEESGALEKFVSNFDIAAEDSEVLRQIKIVEGICFACMKDDVPLEQIKLQPKSFKEATETLARCWKAREELLHRDKKPAFNLNAEVVKADFITYSQGQNANTPTTGQEMVSRQAPNCEFDD